MSSLMRLLEKVVALEHRVKQGFAGMKYLQDQQTDQVEQLRDEVVRLRERLARLEGEHSYIRDEHQTDRTRLDSIRAAAKAYKQQREVSVWNQQVSLEKLKATAPIWVAVIGGLGGLIALVIELFLK